MRIEDVGKEVILNGWVDSRRDHGQLIFVDLRDRYGRTQIVFRSEQDRALHASAGALRNEWVVAVKGIVRAREERNANKDIPTGAIEIEAKEIEILNEAKTPPFEIADENSAPPELRLKHRYLDLRRRSVQKNFITRHKICQVIRSYCDQQGFLEIETPYMIKNTPGGARNFLIPSRMIPGSFFALAESPQLFKQLFMVAGFDKYYQIARCFRDEDLRADRQLEFTQLDMEMSFVKEADVMNVIEGCMRAVFSAILGVDLPQPFPRMSFDAAMSTYGTDKPDIRFGFEIKDIGDVVAGCEFKVFRDCVAGGGTVTAICAKGCSGFSRREIDELTTLVQGIGAKGLVWFKIEEEGKLSSPTAKFLNEREQAALIGKMEAKKGDAIFVVADKRETALSVLGALRTHLRDRLKLVRKDDYRLCWIVDFPMFEWNGEENKWEARHHAFTSPKDEDLANLESDPAKVKAKAYDLVLNGVELGGGSIRIHRRDVQQRMFRLLGITDEEAREKFSFLLEAFEYGAPPHGGIALGMDRMAMLLGGLDGIRDVLAFPKTQRSTCLMTGAPSPASEKHLKELHIKVEMPKANEPKCC